MKVKSSLCLLAIVLVGSMNMVLAQWVQTKGPAGRGGPVYSLCVKDSMVFAGTDNGAYVSKDNGTSWLNVCPNLPAWGYVPSCLSLVASGQSVLASFKGYGVYVSSDNGGTWANATVPANYNISEMDANGSCVIAGGPGPGLYYSTDNGGTWSQLGIPGYITSVAVRDSVVLLGNSSGIMISSDHGSTWSVADSIPSGWGVSAFATSGSRVFAGVDNSVVSSTDRGFTWLPETTALNCHKINAITVLRDLLGKEFVFAGTDSGIFRSTDDGVTWTAANAGISSSLIFSLAGKTNGSGGMRTLFAGTGAGVFRSADFGQTWIAAGIPYAEWFHGGGWHIAASDSLLLSGSTYFPAYGISKYSSYILGDGHCEVYRSSDFGDTWIEADSGLGGPDLGILTSLAVCPNQSGGADLLAGVSSMVSSARCAIFRSTDYGSTWTTVIPDSTIGGTPAIASHDPDVFVGTTSGGVFRSTDRGQNWTRLDSGMITPPYDVGSPSASVNSFSFDGDKIYAGGGNRAQVIIPPRSVKIGLFNYILVSTDRGASWAKADSGFSQVPYISFAYDTGSLLTSIYASGAHLVVGTQAWNYGQATVPSGGGIYHHIKSGSGWTVADSARMGEQIASFAEYGSNLFAASTGKGVIRSKDFGKSWTDVSDGLADVAVTSLVVSHSQLFAATSSGVWKRPLSEITSIDHGPLSGAAPAKMRLAQNYPNPFNPRTSIAYELPSAVNVTLRVYDLLGREVSTIVNERKAAGSYIVPFDARGLASGVYFYRLTAGDRTLTRPMLLLK